MNNPTYDLSVFQFPVDDLRHALEMTAAAATRGIVRVRAVSFGAHLVAETGDITITAPLRTDLAHGALLLDYDILVAAFRGLVERQVHADRPVTIHGRLDGALRIELDGNWRALTGFDQRSPAEVHRNVSVDTGQLAAALSPDFADPDRPGHRLTMSVVNGELEVVAQDASVAIISTLQAHGAGPAEEGMRCALPPHAVARLCEHGHDEDITISWGASDDGSPWIWLRCGVDALRTRLVEPDEVFTAPATESTTTVHRTREALRRTLCRSLAENAGDPAARGLMLALRLLGASDVVLKVHEDEELIVVQSADPAEAARRRAIVMNAREENTNE